MAIAVEMDFNGATLEQYDQVIEKMGFTPGGRGAPGGLFHWVTPTPEGIHVCDVWESRDHSTSSPATRSDPSPPKSAYLNRPV